MPIGLPTRSLPNNQLSTSASRLNILPIPGLDARAAQGRFAFSPSNDATAIPERPFISV